MDMTAAMNETTQAITGIATASGNAQNLSGKVYRQARENADNASRIRNHADEVKERNQKILNCRKQQNTSFLRLKYITLYYTTFKIFFQVP